MSDHKYTDEDYDKARAGKLQHLLGGSIHSAYKDHKNKHISGLEEALDKAEEQEGFLNRMNHRRAAKNNHSLSAKSNKHGVPGGLKGLGIGGLAGGLAGGLLGKLTGHPVGVSAGAGALSGAYLGGSIGEWHGRSKAVDEYNDMLEQRRLNSKQAAYIDGFVKRAAEHGVVEDQAVEMLKQSGARDQLMKLYQEGKGKISFGDLQNITNARNAQAAGIRELRKPKQIEGFIQDALKKRKDIWSVVQEPAWAIDSLNLPDPAIRDVLGDAGKDAYSRLQGIKSQGINREATRYKDILNGLHGGRSGATSLDARVTENLQRKAVNRLMGPVSTPPAPGAFFLG